MTKELLTIEFRYRDVPKSDHCSSYETKTITIGIYDTLDEAIVEGNKVLKLLAVNFEVRADDVFQKKFLFGNPKRVVSNCCYPSNGIQFFAKIEQLKFNNLEDTIDECFRASDRFRVWKNSEEE